MALVDMTAAGIGRQGWWTGALGLAAAAMAGGAAIDLTASGDAARAAAHLGLTTAVAAAAVPLCLKRLRDRGRERAGRWCAAILVPPTALAALNALGLGQGEASVALETLGADGLVPFVETEGAELVVRARSLPGQVLAAAATLAALVGVWEMGVQGSAAAEGASDDDARTA